MSIMRKINVYVNGKYEFSTNKFRTIRELKRHIRAVKHIEVESVPKRYLTVYDYDTLRAVFV